MKDIDFANLKKIYSDDNNVVYDVRNTPFSIFKQENEGYVLDDDIVFGKDYPEGTFDYDIYQILNCLKKEPKLNKLLENLDLKTVYGKDILKHNLLENNYITPISSDNVDIEDEILKMDAGELSNILKQNGIIAFGKKKKLVKLALENISSLDFENTEFELAEKGRKFLKDFKWIELYDICLYDFEFNDFYKFIDENESKDMVQTAFEYVDRHLAHAHECEDFEYASVCMNALSLIYAYIDEAYGMIEEEIRHYIFRINPIYDYKEHYHSYCLLDYYDIEGIKIYASEFGIDNLELMFNSIWDSMNLENEFISKKEAFKFLNELFDEEKFHELCENYLNDVILD